MNDLQKIWSLSRGTGKEIAWGNIARSLRYYTEDQRFIAKSPSRFCYEFTVATKQVIEYFKFPYRHNQLVTAVNGSETVVHHPLTFASGAQNFHQHTAIPSTNAKNASKNVNANVPNESMESTENMPDSIETIPSTSNTTLSYDVIEILSSGDEELVNLSLGMPKLQPRPIPK